jgi:hypothetical protein
MAIKDINIYIKGNKEPEKNGKDGYFPAGVKETDVQKLQCIPGCE